MDAARHNCIRRGACGLAAAYGGLAPICLRFGRRRGLTQPLWELQTESKQTDSTAVRTNHERPAHKAATVIYPYLQRINKYFHFAGGLSRHSPPPISVDQWAVSQLIPF